MMDKLHLSPHQSEICLEVKYSTAKIRRKNTQIMNDKK